MLSPCYFQFLENKVDKFSAIVEGNVLIIEETGNKQTNKQ